MRRLFTRLHFHAALSLLILLLACAVHSQSLGDIARENREKKAATSSAPSKVITNADLQKDPDDDANPPPEKTPATATASRTAAARRAAEQRAAEQWKKKILTQENVIANLQARIDALKASIQFVNPSLYSAGVAYNSYQARRLERLKVMEAQLDQQKRQLEEMQEEARHAGMHTPVYDP